MRPALCKALQLGFPANTRHRGDFPPIADKKTGTWHGLSNSFYHTASNCWNWDSNLTAFDSEVSDSMVPRPQQSLHGQWLPKCLGWSRWDVGSRQGEGAGVALLEDRPPQTHTTASFAPSPKLAWSNPLCYFPTFLPTLANSHSVVWGWTRYWGSVKPCRRCWCWWSIHSMLHSNREKFEVGGGFHASSTAK